MRRRFSNWLRRLAARLDGKVFVEFAMPKASTSAPSDDFEIAEKLGNEIQLRRIMHAALHRYHPAEKPGQC
jgi:hypothetical protein